MVAFFDTSIHIPLLSGSLPVDRVLQEVNMVAGALITHSGERTLARRFGYWTASSREISAAALAA